ncbi:Hypothetical predicted protein [Octopus vulgaris]|uniref:Uncharacterized protein n=1 Tax=Octopus vulgaris TaxID=6645 RepID=A0AA36F9X9_OCTVU|nr:Hypothetical predicted protein [Octopus vulgaris]
MVASTGQCFLLFLVALFPTFDCGTATRASLENVVYSLEKLVGYYRLNYKRINLDGLYGLRILEGQLLLIVSEQDNGQLNHISPSLLSRLKILQRHTTNICKEAIEFVRMDEETYYQKLKYLVERPWMVFKKDRKVSESLRWSPDYYKRGKELYGEIEENTSDNCMQELIGSSEHPRCSISNKCAQIMTCRGLMEYSITHQLLWLMLAEQVGCLAELNRVLKLANFKDHEQLQVEFCSNNFFEMKNLVHDYMSGTILPMYQDLFMEQQFVCPSIGFYEFLHLNYLQQILSWQKESGCFGIMPPVKPKNLKENFFINKKFEEYYYDQNDASIKDKTEMKEPKPLNFPEHKAASIRFVNRLTAPTGILNNVKTISNKPQNLLIQPMPAKLVQKISNNKLSDIGAEPLKPILMNASRKSDKNVAIVNLQNSNKVKNQSEIHLQLVQPMDQRIKPQAQRRLLVEKELSGGCLSHKTAVASGALVIYLNFLLHHSLDQLNHSDTVWHSVNQRLLLNTASKTTTNSLPPVLQPGHLKKVQPVFPNEQKPVPLGGDSNSFVQQETVIKKSFQEPVLGDMGIERDNKKDGVQEDDYEEYENDKFLNENYRDKKVVHFGNNKESLKALDENGDGYDDDSLDEEDEDGDYTYYDENEEDTARQEKINKQQKFLQNLAPDKKQILPRIARNSGFHGRSSQENQETFGNNSSPTGIILITVVFIITVLLLLMYRFIKKRRIHIRYNPRTFLKL